MSEFGYWTFGGKNGLTGGSSRKVVLPDGRIQTIKYEGFPAVLEDEFIIFPMVNSLIARKDFFRLLPNLDPVSKQRIEGLMARNPGVFKKPLISHQEKSDDLQTIQVLGIKGRGRRQ
jgi:hypothetical protein